jgi:hypothetical protein
MKHTSSLLLVAVVLMTPLAANAGWFGPNNYEECMLDKMKGQTDSMYLTARTACAKLFKLEQEMLSTRGVVKAWDYESGSVTITVDEKDTDYRFHQRTIFVFSQRM